MKQDFSTLDEVLEQRPIDAQTLANEVSVVEAQISGYMLRTLRKQERLSQAQVAERMGISQRRVSAIERGDVARTEVHTIVSYVQALGGSVRLEAVVDGETTVIADYGALTLGEAAAR